VDSVTINRATSAAVFQSRATVKADAAEQVFSIDCATIGWAVVDSGIDAAHPAFFDWDTSSNPDGEPVGLRVRRAFDFHDARRVLADRSPSSSPGLVDWRQVLPFVEMSLEGPQESLMDFRGVSDADLSEDRHAHRPTTAYRPPAGRHGTHVAGVLGGHWPVEGLRGICPNIRLYDFRVLDGQGHGDEFSVLAAMQAIRYINEQAGRLVIASVNLSLSVPHDVAAHACGWTPVCQEAERLVRSGVVVVAAAGNAGFGEITRTTGDGYRPTSVSDPGNADAVITVGSTHRNNPHRHGISYFSGRGPTADGRAKPDLIAPGEDIDGPVPGGEIMAMHGTSQAAAHVSGAAAMLMARHRELIGRPERIKQILCATATDLGRERAFQGHGLVDVLRAIQSL
jgi:subtilisin family serine protease